MSDTRADDPEPIQNAQDLELPEASLQGVLSLMAEEVERLKLALEYFRLTDHPDKEERIRWHVMEIDRRQDELEELKALILKTSDDAEH
ncbi:MAG: hypothetical protein AAF541_14035 [Pseudomonadota bacterium]